MANTNTGGTHLLTEAHMTYVSVDGKVQPHPVPKAWVGTDLLAPGAEAVDAPTPDVPKPQLTEAELAKIRAEIRAEVEAELAKTAEVRSEQSTDKPNEGKPGPTPKG